MFRIDDPGAAASLPTPASAGTQGYFQSGTIVTADWLNAVQEEIVAVLAAAGASPSKSTRTQLRDALRTIHGGGFIYLTGSGNWTVPAGVVRVLYEAWGGGGGGGGASGAGAAGGGSAGQYRRNILTVTPGDSIAYSVGTGGTGASGSFTGGTGGDTTFAGTVTCKGGLGGAGVSTGTGVGASLPGGGSGGSGNLHIPGVTGTDGVALGSAWLGGMGGAAFGSGSPGLNVDAAGRPGMFPGCGGNGGANVHDGGAGGDGLLILRW